MEVLKAEHLTKVYGSGENEVRALDDVSFYIQRGEFVAIIGPSGSGIGIGLALSRMIIKQQNGAIKAENRAEGGARFTIRFYKSIV